MIQASNEYKQMMKKPIRNRGYVSVALGVINQNAQGDVSYMGTTDESKRYFSNGDVTKDNANMITYGTLEDNFTKADGKFLFPPRNNLSAQFLPNGFVSESYSTNSDIRITFNNAHDIKGLTIEFEPTAYPTEFDITAYNGNTQVYYETVQNDDGYIVELDTTFGEIDRIELFSDSMSGGTQAWHIKRILMGVGVSFQNDVIESTELESFISGISAEASYKDFNLKVLDSNNVFDVDQTDSFINYLEPLQPISISYCVDLDNGKKEWLKVADLKLKEWNSTRGKVSFIATDLLSQDEANYSHMVLQTRTAKSEFEAIFASMGLTASDYEIDDYLASINITNPVEENTHRDCLQLLANATRSIVFEDENGIIHVEKAFDAYMPPSEQTIALENIHAVADGYLSDNPTDEYGVFVDKSKNLFNTRDEDNNLYIDEYDVASGSVSLEVRDNSIMYSSSPAYQSNVDWAKVYCEIGQTSEHRPFKEAGNYVVSFKYPNDSANSYAIPVGALTGKVHYGNIEIVGTNNDASSFRLNITQEAINSGETPILEMEFGANIRGYSGYIDLKIEKGTTRTVYDVYKYLPAYPQITAQWNDLMPFSQFKANFSSAPGGINITTYANDTQVYSQDFYSVPQNFSVFDTLGTINKVVLTIYSATPNQTLEVYDFSIGNIEPYSLATMDIYEIAKAKEPKIKAVRVKVYTYQDDGGDITRVDDDVWYTETLGAEGIVKTCENPLISTSAQAELIAKWLANYYSKSKSYDIDFRGEPRLQAHDYIGLENQYTDALVVCVEKCKLSFDGAFHGVVEARQAN